MNVHEYFIHCEKEISGKITLLRRTSFTLRRAGVNTMEQLCDMRTRAPDELARLRDIGTQSLTMIDQVIGLYEGRNTGGQQTNNDI